ncbi:hypothetical protein ACFXPN_34580 [Streptomyces griseorubiginosus]|uniref:hypothetical protein n=1 Tax=Streptomyces griseorubiginosus TaxID=67304 RepID=UPI002E80245E|nr:hypothetical protein [Streptomyces griseorubiginosus]WUB45650.1 hypothetical protein OHN19_20750 [Streptomyces griseorubiginosus]WUB54168.1 hypothetical protein OG942_20750 [Streptomyces griseorubiginosus]
MDLLAECCQPAVMQGVFSAHHNFDTPGMIYSAKARVDFPVRWTDIPFVAHVEFVARTE